MIRLPVGQMSSNGQTIEGYLHVKGSSGGEDANMGGTKTTITYSEPQSSDERDVREDLGSSLVLQAGLCLYRKQEVEKCMHESDTAAR